MALTDKKYEKFYKTTGSGADEIDSAKLTVAEAGWDVEKAEGCKKYIEDPILAPLVFQLQQMQDELDYLRTEISTNKDKATFPGLGTSSGTALAGDTTVISKAQADAITANTAKTTFPGFGTSKGTALQGNTVIPIPTVNSGKNIEVLFDNLKVGLRGTTIDLQVADTSTGKKYLATITLK